MSELFQNKGSHPIYERLRDPASGVKAMPGFQSATKEQQKRKLTEYKFLRFRMTKAWESFEENAENSFIHNLQTNLWPGWFELYLQSFIIKNGFENKATNGGGEPDFIVHAGDQHWFDMEATVISAGNEGSGSAAPRFSKPTSSMQVHNVSDEISNIDQQNGEVQGDKLVAKRNPLAQTDFCLRITNSLSEKKGQIQRWNQSGTDTSSDIPMVVAISSALLEYETDGMLTDREFERVLYGKGHQVLSFDKGGSLLPEASYFEGTASMTNKNSAPVDLALFLRAEYECISAVAWFPDYLLSNGKTPPVIFLNPNARIPFPTGYLPVGHYKTVEINTVTVIADYRFADQEPLDLNQQISIGRLTSLTGFSREIKLKVHRSATETLFTFHDPWGTCQINCGDVVSYVGVIGSEMLPFSVPKLYVEKKVLIDSGVLFSCVPFNDTVTIGVPGTLCVSITREVNALLPNISGLRIGKYICKSEPKKTSQLTQRLIKQSKNTTIYKSELTLVGPPQSSESYDSIACSLLRLFGVMLSGSLYTSRTRYHFVDTGCVDNFWFNSGAGIGFSKSVFRQEEFIKSTYPKWASMSDDLRTAVENSSSYIATSSSGYLDGRMFALFQAWELIANVLNNKVHRSTEQASDRIEHKKHRKELGVRLKATYEVWREEFSIANHNDIVDMESLIHKSKVIVSRDSVDLFVELSNIDAHKLNFNINGLRRIANNVRHTGIIGEHDEYGDDLALYDKTKFALQLILFRMLGYKGFVVDRTGEFQRIELVEYYFEN